MATSYRDFKSGLYEEHLEEISFLYEQRLGLFRDPEIGWLDLRDLEEWLEAHIDALVVGEDLALAICRQRAEDGNFGELYAAACVFCRQGRRDLLSMVLKELDPEDDERMGAVSDALRHEMSIDWATSLIGGLSRGFEKLIPIFADYVGYRRFSAGGALTKLVDAVNPSGVSRLAWAFGRTGSDAVVEWLRGCLEDESGEVRASAAMALLRRGDTVAAGVIRDGAGRGDSAMLLPLAVSGGRSDAVVLHKTAADEDAHPDLLIALGVLGELGAVRMLVEKLTNNDLAAAAAADALQLITGAGLREEAFIPEEIDEDELFDEELEMYKETGEGPKHLDGRPFGVNVERISQDPKAWYDWLYENKNQFDASQRYRLGKPFTPETLVDTLVSESSNFTLRSLAYEELVVRYGIDVPFETDMSVDQQKKCINEIAHAVRASESMFEAGQWYFSGQQIA